MNKPSYTKAFYTRSFSTGAFYISFFAFLSGEMTFWRRECRAACDVTEVKHYDQTIRSAIIADGRCSHEMLANLVNRDTSIFSELQSDDSEDLALTKKETKLLTKLYIPPELETESQKSPQGIKALKKYLKEIEFIRNDDCVLKNLYSYRHKNSIK